jgi:hypothetical protein
MMRGPGNRPSFLVDPSFDGSSYLVRVNALAFPSALSSVGSGIAREQDAAPALDREGALNVDT